MPQFTFCPASRIAPGTINLEQVTFERVA